MSKDSEKNLRVNEDPTFFNRPHIIFQLEQIGIGMSVTCLPAILSIKERYQDIFIKCHEHHVPILKYFVNEDNLYP